MKLIRRVATILSRTKQHYAHYRHSQTYKSAYRPIHRIINAHRGRRKTSRGAEAYKLFCLDRLLEEQRPQHILELGAGTTTAICASYVRNTPGSTQTIIDENETLLDAACNIAAIKLTPQFSSIVAPAVRKMRNSNVSYEYDWKPVKNYDFIMVNGPDLGLEQTAVSGNILDLLVQEPETIVIDNLKPTASLLQGYLEQTYQITRSDTFTGRYYPGYNYFSIFRLRAR